MDQSHRPTPSLFSHETAPLETDSTASNGAIQRPVFSSGTAPQTAPPDVTDAGGAG